MSKRKGSVSERLRSFLGSTDEVVGDEIHDDCWDFSDKHRGREQPSDLPNRAIREDKNRQNRSAEEE